MSTRLQVPIKPLAKAHPPAFAPARVGLLQRCGGHPCPPSGCTERRKERLLQRRPWNEGAPSAVPPIVEEVLRSPGQPLEPATRALMEPRFGHDFGAVRVHTDARAAESARSVNALAYTVGRDVVFGAGQYASSSAAGQRLLAHELTHVVQQSHGSAPDGSGKGHPVQSIGPNGGWLEKEAQRVAEVYSPNEALKTRTNESMLQRQPAATPTATPQARAKVCGPDITGVIVSHLNEFVSQKEGNLNPIWFFGAGTLQPYARRNAVKVRAEAAKVSACPIHSDCRGTYTVGGKCISGYHIDHILIMAYIEASYGARTARSAGQYNESFWLGFVEEGAGFEGSEELISNADLTFNEVAICLGGSMAHAEERGSEQDRLTEEEVSECFRNAEMAVIGRKPAYGTSGTRYTDCGACPVSAPEPTDLELPPIDL